MCSEEANSFLTTNGSGWHGVTSHSRMASKHPFCSPGTPVWGVCITNMMAGGLVGEAEAVVPRVSWQCSLPSQLESSPPLQVGLGLLPVATLFWVWRGSRLLRHGPSHIFGDPCRKILCFVVCRERRDGLSLLEKPVSEAWLWCDVARSVCRVWLALFWCA